MASATRPVVVVMPFRDVTGDPHRVEALAYVTALYRQWVPDWTLTPPDDGVDAEWHRVAALNRMCAAAPGDAVIVYSDPGSFVAGRLRIREAAAMAGAALGLVVPFTEARYLSRWSSLRVTTWPFEMSAGELSVLPCDEVVPNGVGNLVVFTRETWGTVGGFDERFGLYGGDDGAFAVACGAWFGPHRRLPGDVIHLWHPRLRASIPGTAEYLAQFELVAEYRDANEVGPDAVKRLVANR